MGKGTQFPLADESKRVRSHDDDVALEEEVRLLLHPCIDDPEEQLTFDEQGLVHPAMLKDGPSQKGKASINVYALQRKLLVEERLTEINALRTSLMHLQSYVRNHNNLVSMPNDTTLLRRDNAVDIKRSLQAIADLMRPNTEFVAPRGATSGPQVIGETL
ncbi:hypothetical protein J2Y48_002759 [Mycoplana sp. BE70]|uniref:hypothetical protein n=1 Tax=Mycoplana sp. BE70 TaxID=2817775 RepID=UPI002862E5B2|nr:hypothetical protein [Mycoplana sp. BE70]MDR6757463.1 hypothetical protein [Mycoplana sp. BE70]